MPKFTVVYVKGRAAGKGDYAQFEPLSGKTLYNVEAANRILAYIKAYQHLSKLGMNVFVAKEGSDGARSPLGLTTREIEVIASEGVPLETQVTDGVRIDKIVREN